MTANAPFDRALIDRRRVRAAARAAPGASFLLDAVADELAERLSLVQRQFAVGVELAGHTGALAARLGQGGQVERLLRLERDKRFLGPGEGVVADEEALPLRDESVDLVLSPLSLHLTNDTPGVLVQIRRALRPDGLFLAALLGGETLNELRASLLAAEAEISGGASPRVAPFADLREAGGLLQRAGFALPVIDQDRLTVRYASMFELMRDLRDMGMSNMLHARARRPVGRQLFFRAAEIYAERFADADGRLRATFDVVYLSGWKPHESQQKPLKPGSATHSLAEALRPKG
ncbi:methyltransferase domain-containing protein [uncultured Aureimonas sp.]|uniref:class I SAM-dependent methyltransferase n=1 Tax=uncultured Aureimonas sp. TaxID=1604662 RepID=UPI0025D03C27|nr:methyltransferase domain-containing protein [uncultured Aureimonas sp.]